MSLPHNEPFFRQPGDIIAYYMENTISLLKFARRMIAQINDIELLTVLSNNLQDLLKHTLPDATYTMQELDRYDIIPKSGTALNRTNNLLPTFVKTMRRLNGIVGMVETYKYPVIIGVGAVGFLIFFAFFMFAVAQTLEAISCIKNRSRCGTVLPSKTEKKPSPVLTGVIVSSRDNKVSTPSTTSKEIVAQGPFVFSPTSTYVNAGSAV